ncbi:MAG: hypothetical protein JWO03_2991 [Bacteroidetes bacterium]|nr:hypothetical protein [Bacteroidota bacterium]
MSKSKKTTPLQPVNDSELISNVYSLEELFIIPLRAVIDANAYAAQTALDFILSYGFNNRVMNVRDSNEFAGNLRMLSFTYTFTDDRGIQKTTKVNIPFISLIPIPLLEVKRAQFDYAIQILNQESRILKDINDRDTEQKSLVAVLAPMDTSGKNSLHLSEETSLKANMTVRVEVEKSDLPAGILQLLNLGQQAIAGTTEDNCVIISEPDMLTFTGGVQRPYRLKAEVKRKGKAGTEWESIKGAEVQVHVICSMTTVEKIFGQPITVEKGYVVGVAGTARAKALTDANGVVEFGLWPDTGVSDDYNGFVLLKTRSAEDSIIYYNFKQTLPI